MKNLLLLSLSLICGCSFLHSKTTSDPKTGLTKTTVTAYTVFDGQSALTKFQNRGSTTVSNEWAAGTSIGGLNQASSSTNLNDILSAVVGAAVKAAK